MTATRFRHSLRTNPEYHEGPHASDVPTCSRCGRGPGDGISFLRPGYEFGGECDRCAQRIKQPARYRDGGDFDTRPENPAMDEADRYLPAAAPVRGGYAGLYAARELRAQENGLLTTERFINADGTYAAKGWIARITKSAPGARYEFEREFIDPVEQHPDGNGARTLRDYAVFMLADGIYEADTVGRDGANKRLYFRVADGRIAVVYKGKRDARVALS